MLSPCIAHNNDFLTTRAGEFTGFNTNGSYYRFHQHFYQTGAFDKSLLLYAYLKQEDFAEILAIRLPEGFSDHEVQEELLPVKEIISLKKVKTKVKAFLLRHA